MRLRVTNIHERAGMTLCVAGPGWKSLKRTLCAQVVITVLLVAEPHSPWDMYPTHSYRMAQPVVVSRPVSRHCDQMTTVVGELHAGDDFCKQSREVALASKAEAVDG